MGTQARACTLCSPDVGPFPACLPRPARPQLGAAARPQRAPRTPGAAAGPDLPRALPGLLSPVPSAMGTTRLPSPPLPSCPQLGPISPHPAAPTASLAHRVHAGHWFWAVELGPACGAGPPRVPCSGHLEVPVHAEPWAGAGQGRKDPKAEGRGPLLCPPRSTHVLGLGGIRSCCCLLNFQCSGAHQSPRRPVRRGRGQDMLSQGQGEPPGPCTVGIFQGRRELPES